MSTTVEQIAKEARAARHRIVRLDTSPMNTRVKLATLECGHELWLRPPMHPRVGMKVVCPTCFATRKNTKEPSHG